MYKQNVIKSEIITKKITWKHSIGWEIFKYSLKTHETKKLIQKLENDVKLTIKEIAAPGNLWTVAIHFQPLIPCRHGGPKMPGLLILFKGSWQPGIFNGEFLIFTTQCGFSPTPHWNTGRPVDHLFVPHSVGSGKSWKIYWSGEWFHHTGLIQSTQELVIYVLFPIFKYIIIYILHKSNTLYNFI